MTKARLDTAGLGAMAALALAAGAENGIDVSYKGLKRGLREAVTRDPMEAALVTVLGGSYLFYLAEKDHNPKVNTFWDALVFITTCLNVGYADIFAKTPAGQAIASAIMTVGPALVGSIFEPPEADKPADPTPQLLAVQEKIATTLDAILSEMRTKPA